MAQLLLHLSANMSSLEKILSWTIKWLIVQPPSPNKLKLFMLIHFPIGSVPKTPAQKCDIS